jgi:hypothetical protein
MKYMKGNKLSSSILVMILAMGSLFVILSISDYLRSNSAKIPEPQITEGQAVQAVESDLQNRTGSFDHLEVYVSAIGYKPFSDFNSNNYHLPLVYSHPNGTLFYLNSTNHAVYAKCTPMKDKQNCSWSKSLAEKTAGRLVYGLDIYWFNKGGIATSDYYVVDARSGHPLFSVAKIGEKDQ